jgi:hypothetical protein
MPAMLYQAMPAIQREEERTAFLRGAISRELACREAQQKRKGGAANPALSALGSVYNLPPVCSFVTYRRTIANGKSGMVSGFAMVGCLLPPGQNAHVAFGGAAG